MLDWTTMFLRFPPGPTRLIGPVIVRVADWSRPGAGRARISDSVWLDRLTCAHPGFMLAADAPAGIWLVIPHNVIHRGRVAARLGRYRRHYHLAHHYARPDRHFGVLSPLWDVAFRAR